MTVFAWLLAPRFVQVELPWCSVWAGFAVERLFVGLVVQSDPAPSVAVGVGYVYVGIGAYDGA